MTVDAVLPRLSTRCGAIGRLIISPQAPETYAALAGRLFVIPTLAGGSLRSTSTFIAQRS